MNIFLFNKSLRIQDNTTLIEQTINEKNILPIFIFTEQINNKKNKYYSSNSGNFLLESINDLQKYIKKYEGELYCFNDDNIITVFDNIKKINNIISIGYNFDYSPYALDRQKKIDLYCNKNNIRLYFYEDLLLYDMLKLQTLKKDFKPYKVFTPFKNNCLKNLKFRSINKFDKFNFLKCDKLYKCTSYIKDINIFKKNDTKQIYGNRQFALNILYNNKKFKNYEIDRNYTFKETTLLSAYINFGLISIREVYFYFKNNDCIINQLIWRQFNTNIIYYFPYILQKQIINKENSAFNVKYNNIKWENNINLFNHWKQGTTGFPLVDAGMRQLKTGYMHNRLRMICADFLTKLLLIDWRRGEQYFAQQLTDYNSIQNICGWLWVIGGIDPKQPLRLFNPFTQSIKYDKDCVFIKQFVSELLNIDNNIIHNYNELTKRNIINYNKPIIDYVKNRKRYFDIIKTI